IRFCNHQEFLQVFNLYGIEVLRIDGNMPFAKRQTVVDAFHTEGSPRVLIFSSVGTAGLNLSIADVVILLVHCLDFNFYMSLILGIGSTLECTGRAPNHRPCPPSTSKNEVVVIQLLALGTTDVLMSGMARGKHEMFEAFVT